MNKRIKRYNQIGAVLVFVLLPILLYAIGDFPRRSMMKEIISIITIEAFFMMLMQFYLSRANKNVLKEGQKMGRVIKWHKVLGYVFVSILLLHPFLIVIPRYFEAGIDPKDAFTLLLTTNTKGVILGIISWCLMLLIGVTSAFRGKLGLSYKTWRTLHGSFSIVFIGLVSFHVIDSGRHMNLLMTILIATLSTVGIALLLKIYFFQSSLLKRSNHE